MRAAMEEACGRHGRDPATLRRHVSLGALMPGHTFVGPDGAPNAVPLTGTAAAVAEQLARFARLGVQRVSF
jgi:hypothetical protein